MRVEDAEGSATGAYIVFGSQGEDCETDRTDDEGTGFTITTCNIYLVDGRLASVAWVGRSIERRDPIRWSP